MDICLHVCLAKIRTLEYLDQTMDPDQSVVSVQLSVRRRSLS